MLLRHEVEKFEVPQRWREGGKVAFVLAHPDDELLFFSLLQSLLDQQISVLLLSFTLGEKGIPLGSRITPHEMGSIRRQEFINAAAYAPHLETRSIRGFFDAELASPETQGLMTQALMEIVRSEDIRGLVTFDPRDFAPDFSHQDHRTVGEVTSNVADHVLTQHYLPEIEIEDLEEKARLGRPSLIFWTSLLFLATHYQEIPFETQIEREQYLFKNYPSQAGSDLESKNQWRQHFARIFSGKIPNKQHQHELYGVIR